MLVRCNHYKDCPIPADQCAHKEEHGKAITMKLPNGKRLRARIYCDDQERLCALRYPEEAMMVKCQPVEGGKRQASVAAEHKEPITV